MHPLLAANPFDNPWAVAIVLIVGALVNWLGKRLQDRQAAQPPPNPHPTDPAHPTTSTAQTLPPTANPRPHEFNLEDALRQILGVETPPPPTHQPPVISDSARTSTTPIAVARDSEVLDAAQPTLTFLPEPTRQSASSPFTPAEPSTPWNPTSPPFDSQGLHGSRPTPPPTQAPIRRAKRHSQPRISPWRTPRGAREAWIASVVFGPPPSLKP